jgi:hypothetical protein
MAEREIDLLPKWWKEAEMFDASKNLPRKTVAGASTDQLLSFRRKKTINDLGPRISG